MSPRTNRRDTILLLLAFAVATALVALANRGQTQPTDPVHPENPDPNGARAVAQVLAEQGTDVSIADGQAAFLETTIDERTVVLVTATEELGPRTADTLADQAANAASVVVVLPDPPLLGRLGGSAAPAASGPVDAKARCHDSRFGDLDVEVAEAVTYTTTRAGTARCFPGEDGHLVLSQADGDLTLLGSAELLMNRHVTRADHAALALRLLGEHQHLVWYHASVDDLGADEVTSAAGVLPDWLLPGVLLVGAATVALVLWRGRRLGPLVVEPLPVTVRSVEAAESRGRLYRRVRDQEHAADALRQATRRRLVHRVGLARGTSTATLVRELAERTGRPVDQLTSLLQTGVVSNDAGLVTLAEQLAQLEDALAPYGATRSSAERVT